MSPEKPKDEPASLAEANPGPKDQAPNKEIEAACDKLAELFFETEHNPWVNGIAISALPEGPGILRVPGQAAPPKIEDVAMPKADAVIFMNPSAPKCAVDEVNRAAGKFLPSFLNIFTSRFVALAGAGDSISPQDSSRYNVSPFSTGTLGAFLKVNGRAYILGSNHVVAHNGRVPRGANIVSPGPLDDPTGGPVLGLCSYYVELQPQAGRNLVDCALAEVPIITLPPTPVNPLPPGAINLGQKIRKRGRTTLETHATLNLAQWQGPIDFTFGTYFFQKMLGAHVGHDVFAAPGDSGSLTIVDDAVAPKKGVGLVTARAYTFDAANNFLGYVILMCSLDAVATALVTEMNRTGMNLKTTNLEFLM